jgi:hypothetical protein
MLIDYVEEEYKKYQIPCTDVNIFIKNNGIGLNDFIKKLFIDKNYKFLYGYKITCSIFFKFEYDNRTFALLLDSDFYGQLFLDNHSINICLDIYMELDYEVDLNNMSKTPIELELCIMKYIIESNINILLEK